ncbi:MAG: molybdopterin guanine dinucleotide-containing S/N-oxide reductase [Pseudomonadota bacterium]
MNDQSGLRVTPFSTHWGTYFAEVRDGKLEGVRDYSNDPDPAVIGPGIVDMVDHPTRITQPMVRKGYLENGPDGDRTGRGREPFVAVSWDKALDLAAAELERVRTEHGNESIFGGSYGWASAGRFHHAQSHIHRFLNCIGGYTASISNYSYAAANAITPHIVGPMRSVILDTATSWPIIAEHSELVVAFGGLARKNAQVTSGGVGRHVVAESLRAAHANGCQFINVSPLATDIISDVSPEWMAPRPNTDTALMIGLAHTLLAEGLQDESFLQRCCVGWEAFRAYLTGEADGITKNADWASSITEISAEDIRNLARRMASKRTMITVAWSLQRADHGEQPIWMAVVLASMLGQVGQPGGGFGIGYASENGIGNSVLPFQFPAVPQGRNAVRAAIPVARISDLLLNPGGDYQFNGRDLKYPKTRLVYWGGGNPFHHHQDLKRLTHAMHQPETVIVNEIWWTQMARHADIVFPATTVLEREDISMTHWEPLIVAMRKAIEPVGGGRSDYEIFTGIAERMGLRDAYTEGRSAEEWIGHLWDQTRQRAGQAGFALPTLDELREQETCELPPNPSEPILLEAFVRDPEANPLTTPTGKIEIFSDTIAGFGYDDCPGHPVWMEPFEWLGVAEEGEFHLISNQPVTRLHSQFDPGRVSKASKIAGREPLTLNSADAASMGLDAGDVAKVWNARGACLAGVRISNTVRNGVIQLSTGAWYDPDLNGEDSAMCKHGNPNVLTRDSGSSRLGQGNSAHTTLVRLEKVDNPPPVTAFLPPVILFDGETSD